MRRLRTWIGVVLMALAPMMRADDTQPRARALDLRALQTSTVAGEPSPQAVVPPTSFSLNLEGDLELGGFVFKDGIPFIHNEGGTTYGNTAAGLNALASVTPAPHPTVPQYVSLGASNTAMGYSTLRNTTTGRFNTALGSYALQANTEGIWNVAAGSRVLEANTTGDGNTGIGHGALLWHESGFENTAVGIYALSTNISGNLNTAIGAGAGSVWKTGSLNIAIGMGAYGRFYESGVIRIGGYDNQSTTYIEGINNAEVAGSHVCITADDELGLCPTPGPPNAGLSPVLLAEIRRLEAELAALRQRLDRLERDQQ